MKTVWNDCPLCNKQLSRSGKNNLTCRNCVHYWISFSKEEICEQAIIGRFKYVRAIYEFNNGVYVDSYALNLGGNGGIINLPIINLHKMNEAKFKKILAFI